MIGQTISHYQILDQLGAGGMGEVYRARDTKLGRQVALKFLPADAAQDAQARARFIHEAQAAGALDHPNIGTIYEIGEWAQQLFIAMACYDGETLKQRIARGPLEFAEVESILTQIAAGLSAAHTAGIVHRDLKPANVMLASSGQIKILDFGLAKLAQVGEDAETRLTKTGTIMGTVVYMSPEQAQGEDVDHRSDLWSLGVIAYEMLTGALPFRASSQMETLNRILTTEPKSLSELRASVPPYLRLTVERLLKKKADERIQSAGEVAQSLSQKIAPDGSLRVDQARLSAGDQATLPPLMESRSRSLLQDWRLRVATGLVIVAAIIAGYAFWPKRDGVIPTAEAASVVVLPAKVLGAQELGYLTDAIPSTLSTHLGSIEGLETKAPPTSIEFESIKGDLNQIAELYGVKTGVVSEIIADADRFVLNVKLVELRSRSVLWSKEYDGKRGSYIELARQAADGVRQALRPTAAPATSGAGLAANSEAELAFRQGQHFLNRYNNQHRSADFDLALAALKRAFELDPKLAEAAADIAVLYSFKAEAGAPPQDMIPEIEVWARRALEIDPRSSKGWFAHSRAENFRSSPSQRKMLEYSLKAASFGPQQPLAHMGLCGAMREASFELALTAALESRRLDPLYLYPSINAADLLRYLGRPTQGLPLLEEVLTVEPDMPYCLLVKSSLLLDLSRIDEATDLLKRLETLPAENRMPASILLPLQYELALRHGETRAAEAALGGILKIVNDPQSSGQDLADVYDDAVTYLGRHDKADLAFRIMTRSLAAGYIPSYDWLMLSPNLAPLRADARFKNISARSRAQFGELLAILEEARARREMPQYLEAPLAELVKKLGIK
jgi:TolB-like protein